MNKVLSCLRKAVEDYNMIEDGDIVGVGVSGGKDSVVLLYALHFFQKFAPVKYELKAISLTMGFDDFDLTPIKNLCKKIGVEYIVQETEIGRVVFEERNEKNPCSLCSRFKRAALHTLCQEHSINKLALGHHLDDAIETMFLSMFYEGRVNTFSPVTYLSRRDLTVIRPLIYAEERELKGVINRKGLPVVKSTCPADDKTQRKYMKDKLLEFYKDIPHARKRLLTAMQNKEQMNLW